MCLVKGSGSEFILRSGLRNEKLKGNIKQCNKFSSAKEHESSRF